MGRGLTQGTQITPENVQSYLRTHGHPDAVVQSMAPLGVTTQEGMKAFGYGRPLRVRFTSGGKACDVAIRTMSPDPFGHDRRADRLDVLVLQHDTFGKIPGHIEALDVGVFDGEGRLTSLPPGEGFLVTSYVEGELYARDLHELKALSAPRPLDLSRTRALASYLATLHSEPREPSTYRRSIRDTIAAGEGIFGQSDGYPDDHPVATQARLMAIEQAAVAWRYKLRGLPRRARRSHGDFHPFNLLFREGDDFSVLDCSRGGAGEPADDVTCLAVNYLFFGLTGRGHFKGPERALWDAFFETYLAKSGDRELLSLVAPFFTWRILVVASPVWYPNLEDSLRDRLLRFAERLLAGAPFSPERVEELLA